MSLKRRFTGSLQESPIEGSFIVCWECLLIAPIAAESIDRFPASGETGRPEKTLKEIISSGKTGLDEIFRELFIREGIYSFRICR